jgi:hypothetical protein
MEKSLVAGKHATDIVQGLDDASLVVHVHHRDKQGVGTQCGGNLPRSDRPIRLRQDQRDGKSLAGKVLDWFEHRFVLNSGGNDVLPAGLLSVLSEAKDGEVVALGGATGKGYPLPLPLASRPRLELKIIESAVP